MKRRCHHWFLVGTVVSLVFATHRLEQTSGRELPGSRKHEPTEPRTSSRGIRYHPDNRRDPFLNPLLLNQSSGANDEEEESRGEPPPGIAGTYIAQAVLLGISQKKGARTAIFQAADRQVYFLHEGDRLFDGHVEKIQDDTVLLVRETRLKSGTVLTREITKKLRSP